MAGIFVILLLLGPPIRPFFYPFRWCQKLLNSLPLKRHQVAYLLRPIINFIIIIIIIRRHLVPHPGPARMLTHYSELSSVGISPMLIKDELPNIINIFVAVLTLSTRAYT